MEIYAWLFGVAVVFTVVGYRWGKVNGVHGVVGFTIDNLMKQGYLKYRRNSTGEVEILKHDETG